MQFSERLKHLRERETLSQSALAKAIGATRAAVNAWEMGISHPNTQFLVSLALYFHISTDYLLGLEDGDRISLSSLNEEERHIVLRLVHYFDNIHNNTETAGRN